MPLVSRVRPKLGDVVEISTSQGLAYAHYTHEHSTHPKYGSLLRILPGFHASRPDDFVALVTRAPSFSAFYPLGAACNRKLVTIVANEPIAEGNRAFPIFRSRMSRAHPWWLWNGLESWKAGDLSAQQLKDFPPREIWNHALLVERIEQGWRHEFDLGPLPPVALPHE